MAKDIEFSVGDRVRFKPAYEYERTGHGLPNELVVRCIETYGYDNVAFFEGQHNWGAYVDRLERLDGPW